MGVDNMADLNKVISYNWLDGSDMPHKMDNAFMIEEQFSGIVLDDRTKMMLQDSFYKYLPTDEPGGAHNQPKLDPAHLQRIYEKLGMNITDPSLYSMVCWMA